MYECKNITNICLASKIANTTMYKSMIQNLVDYAAESDTWLGEDNFNTFKKNMENSVNHIAKTFKMLDYYKEQILDGMAKQKESLPKDFSPELTLELFKNALSFVADFSSISVPSLETEFAIGMSLRHTNEKQDEYDSNDYFRYVNSGSNVKEAVQRYCNSNGLKYTPEEMDSFLLNLQIRANDLRQSDTDRCRIVSKDLDYIKKAFDEIILSQNVLDYSIYDNNYLFLSDYTVAEIKASDENKHLKIVTPNEPSLLDMQTQELQKSDLEM